MFKITDYIEFDAKGRAVCPSCALDGKTSKKNLALIPDTDGAYKCHRGCTPAQIREALGQPRDKQMPAALAAPNQTAPTTVTPQKVREAHERLMQPSGEMARQWLIDRGITELLMQHYQLGLVRSKQGDRMLAAISIPIATNADGTHYWQKKRVAPWSTDLPEDFSPWSQRGIPAKCWFTWRPAEATETWLCEGEWDAILLGWAVRSSGLPVAVATFTCGCSAVPPASELEQLPGDVIIFYDRNDQPLKSGIIPGDAGAKKVAAALGDRGRVARVPMPDDCQIHGWDVSNALNHGFTLEHFMAAANQAMKVEPELPTEKSNSLKSRLVWNDELMARATDYTEWLVPDLLTANELFLLASGPRVGKSLMSMMLAKAVASGGDFLGRPVTQGKVLYICLEDGENKLKEREIAQGWAEGLPVAWIQKFKLSEIPLLRDLADEIDPRLIVIDTLSRAKDSTISESSSEMSQILEPLQEMAKELDCCILLVHHTGKISAENAGAIDIFDTIRGSSAIRAVCRGTLIIAAGESSYRLCAENGWGKHDLNIVLDANTLTWRLLGKWAPQINGNQKDAVIDYLKLHQAATIDQMHDDLGIPRDSLYKVLSRLAQSEIAEEKVVKEGRRRCYTYRLAIFHQAKALLDTIGLSNNLSNSANPDADCNRGAIGQKNNFSSEVSEAISDQIGTPAECANLIAMIDQRPEHFVQYREKTGSNPDGERVSPIGQDIGQNQAIASNPDGERVSPIGQDIGQTSESDHAIGQPLLIDQLKYPQSIEVFTDDRWQLALAIREWEGMLFSPKSRQLERAVYVRLADSGDKRKIPADHIRCCQRED